MLNPTSPNTTFNGLWLLVIAALISFIILLIEYFVPHGTIAHSWGALLVVISTALMVIAGALIALKAVPHWLAVLFEILIILDIIGTGICAWFLETPVVLALMVVALIGWFSRLGSQSKPSGAGPWSASSRAR